MRVDIKVYLIGGFLGVGKTTAIRRLARHFGERGERVAVVTNDQGHTLVDTELMQQSTAMVREIGGGCLCCRYPELEDTLAAAADTGVSVALVEAVGSCTDLVATVIAPMADRHPDRFPMEPLSILVDPWRVREMSEGAFAPDVQYLFRKQIEEADVIVLTRADLAPPDVTEVVREINPEAAIVAFSALTGEGLSEWLAARPRRPASPLAIDYNRYAAAEAGLGWLNGLAVVQSAKPFSPASVVRKLLGALRDAPIAHVKVAVLEPGAGAAAIVRRGGAPVDDLDSLPAGTQAMRLLINGRVALPPHQLEALVRRALIGAAAPADSSWEQLACFAPCRPTPVHRYAYRCGSGDEASCCTPPAAPAVLSTSQIAPALVWTTERERIESEWQALLEREQVARSTAEAAEQRSTFLAGASRALSASLDYRSTLTRVAELAVPSVADFCAVYIEEPGISLHPVAIAYNDPQALEVARAFAIEYTACVTQRDRPGVCSVMQTCSADCMDSEAVDPPDECGSYRELARRLSLSTSMAVPLVARERALGVVLFAYRNRRKNLDADLALGRDLAGRAAFAVDNARLYTEAQQAICARDEFLSIASHELRTPSTALLLGIQMLLRLAGAGRSVTEAASPLVQSVLEKLNRQSQLLEHLINRLLDVARIQSGQLKLELEPNVDLATVTRDVVRDLRDQAAQRGCAIELRTEEVTGEFDRMRLAQVVSNLVSNALRYGAGAPIDIAVERSEGLAGLTVRDHGVGIAPEWQEVIFEPYKRAASARHYGGLGLGLYIVQQIVVAHGGTIHVDSALGAGSTFVAVLPCAARSACGGGP